MSSVKGSDDVARFIRRKAHETEKNMATFKKAIDGYLRSQDRLRGKSLKLALALKSFSDAETPNLSQAIIAMAEGFVDLEESRRFMHDRVEAKVTEPLKLYKLLCKNILDDVKVREQAVDKEQKKQHDYDKTTIKDVNNTSKLSQSHLQLQAAAQDLEHSNNALAQNFERFHLRKINDVKSIFYEIIYSEIQFHSKALEILTNVQSNIFAMDIESDVYEIQEKVKSEKPLYKPA